MTQVSIIIPTYNRLDRLKRVLAALEVQDFPFDQFEVVVISDGSVDGTNEFLSRAQFPYRMVPVTQVNQGVAAARNAGIQKACGEYILFLDDDVVPIASFVRLHVETHLLYGPDVVVLGPMLTPPDFSMSPWVRWEQAMLMRQYEAMQNKEWEPTGRQFYTGNTSLALKHLQIVGGFDPTFRRAEDVELAYRLAEHGIRFVFNPDAVGYHYADRSFESWASIPYAYGQNDVVFTYEKGQSWLLPTIWREYQTRNALTRTLAQVCLDRKHLTGVVLFGLRGMVSFGDRIGSQRLSHLACSGIFNLRHYQGIADGLGGRRAFFEGVEHPDRPLESGRQTLTERIAG